MKFTMHKHISFIIAFASALFFFAPIAANAAIFDQNQLVTSPYPGLIVSTSTASGAKLSATTSPTVGSITATSTSKTNYFGGLAQLTNGFLALASSTVNGNFTVSGLSGIVKAGTGGLFGNAAAGTDYVAPGALTSSGLTMSTNRLIGRTTASTGAPEEISVGTGFALSGGALTLSGIANGSLANSTISGVSLGGTLAALTAGTGLTSAGTYTGATGRTFAIDFTGGYSWSGLNQFNANASTTQLTVTGATYLATGSGNVGIGTTTPNWLLQAAGVRPSFALSDTSAAANLKHWLFSSMGGNLYIGTSTDAFGTSTPPAITISNAGSIGAGSSTPWGLFSLNPSNISGPAFVIGSSTATPFLVTNGGNVGIGTTSPYSRLTLDHAAGVASSSITVAEASPSATSTSMTADCRDSNTLHLAIGGSATTITLAPMVGGQTCKIIISNPNTTAGTITWATTASQQLYWAGGTAPTQTTTANKRDVWSFIGDQMPTNSTTTPATNILGAQTANF